MWERRNDLTGRQQTSANMNRQGRPARFGVLWVHPELSVPDYHGSRGGARYSTKLTQNAASIAYERSFWRSAMRPRSLRSTISVLGIVTAALCAVHLALMAKAAAAPRFHLEEATIADVHRAIRAKEITAEQLVQFYFRRIEAYNGTCVRGEVDPATGLMFGEITPIENAGQVNAYMTLNIRGKRSKTDPADNDPKMLDALETARVQDEYFARSGNFVGPLHGIPVAIKDNYDTIDMRTTSRRRMPPWWQSCARPARSSSARPISTSMRRPASVAARSAARPAIPTTPSASPAAPAPARQRRWPRTSRSARSAPIPQARCAIPPRSMRWSAWWRRRGW